MRQARAWVWMLVTSSSAKLSHAAQAPSAWLDNASKDKRLQTIPFGTRTLELCDGWELI